MKLSQLLVESRVLAMVGQVDKGRLLQRIAEVSARDLPGASVGQIKERLLEREGVSSTGIGQGIAIPHARLSLQEPGGKWLTTPMAILARSKEGLAFDALDGQPVYLIMALISASENREDHLRALSLCSQVLRHEEVRQRLLHARDAATMLAVALGNHEENDE
ncbi:MAG: PTS transporter subunit EIIA [Magnetococcales bacterium]|nr:PTS transporter subunit EIIA [Magnetococcales bacterium]